MVVGRRVCLVNISLSHSHQNDSPRNYWSIHDWGEWICLIGRLIFSTLRKSILELAEALKDKIELTEVNSHGPLQTPRRDDCKHHDDERRVYNQPNGRH